MKLTNTLLILFLLIGFKANSENSIEIIKQADGKQVLVFESTEIFDVAQAQAFIVPEAQKLCGTQFVHLGKYTFDTKQALKGLDDQNSEKADTFKLTQEISCEDAEQSDQSVVTSEDDLNWVAPEQLVKQAEMTFKQFLGLLKKKKYKAAYAMLSKGMKATASYKDWKAIEKTFIKQFGAFESYSDFKITWYKNPANAIEPGIYAAFDYECQFKKADRCSAVMILHLDESNEFKVVRRESNVMEKGLLKSIQNKQIEIKPYPAAKISMQEYNNYYQTINLKLMASKQDIAQSCLEYFADKSTNAAFYFTTSCHPAHPAWITLHVIKQNNQLHMGQIGYFVGDEPAFAELFKAFKTSTEERRKAMAKENGWDN